MSSPESKIIDALGYLIQMHGPQAGLSECLIDADSKSSSVVFTFEGQDYLISSKNIEEVDD